MDQVFTRSNLIHAVSGASGSVISLTLFYPLDSLRTRLQVGDQANPVTVARTVVKQEGIRALYNGWFAVISSICTSNFVYFYAYSALKALHPLRPSPLRDLSSAILAGVTNVLVTTPLWVANTRLKLQPTGGRGRYAGLLDCLTRIAKAEGVSGLWSGTGTSLLLVAAPGVHFALYEAFKRWGAQFFAEEALPGAFVFLASGLAKLVATLVTYPLQVVQSRMRAGKEKEEDPRRNSLLWVIRLLLKNGGLMALYKGFETKIVQTVLTTAFMFVFYEKLVAFIRLLLQAK